MKKAELEIKVKELQEKIENLQSEFDSLNELYGELEAENYELSNIAANSSGIKDINNFKFWLADENLLTDKLLNFINYYMKYRQ